MVFLLEKLLEVIIALFISIILLVLLKKWQNFKKINKNDERGRYVIGKVSSILLELGFLDIIVLTSFHFIIKSNLIFLYAVLFLLAIKIVLIIVLLKKYDAMTS